MAKITYGQLDAAGACTTQLLRFVSLFSLEVEVTEELAVKYAETFEWDWAGMYLLDPSHRRRYLLESMDISGHFSNKIRSAALRGDDTMPVWRQYHQSLARLWARLYNEGADEVSGDVLRDHTWAGDKAPESQSAD